jgi:hypothetical protein
VSAILLMQASSVRAVANAIAHAGYKHEKVDAYADDILRVMSWWHLPAMGGALLSDELVCETGAVLKSWFQVRGAGLAASTFGMLRCSQAVDALVARWTAGRWAGRLTPGWDYVVALRSCNAKPTGCIDRAAAGSARARCGRAPSVGVEAWASLVDTPEVLRVLRGLQPHAAGGGRTALCLPCARLPEDAWLSV